MRNAKSRIKTVIEGLALIAFISLLTYLYRTALGGIPPELLETSFKRTRVDLAYGVQAWMEEGLGSPNKSLHLAPVNLFLSFLTSHGLSAYSAGALLLTILWTSGGLSIYLLAKRLTNSRPAALIASVAYLGSPLAVRYLWVDLETAAFYTLIPIAVTLTDRGFRKNSLYYGFYVALAAAILSSGVHSLELLTLFTLTVMSYPTAHIVDRRDFSKVKWVIAFTSSVLFCWVFMNLWLTAVSPVAYNIPDIQYLSAVLLFLLITLLTLKAEKFNVLETFAVLLIAAIMLFDIHGIMANTSPIVSALLCMSLSLSLAPCAKLLLQRLEEYFSVTLIVERDKHPEREVNLSRPAICIVATAFIVSQGIAANTWCKDLGIPEPYTELNDALPEGYYRVLSLPVACGQVYYNWSPKGYYGHVESLMLDRPVISGCSYAYLNELCVKRGFWKLLSVLDAKLLILHMDVDHRKTECVNPRELRSGIENNRLSYDTIVLPHIQNGSVELSGVTSLTEDFGFIHLVHYNTSRIHRVEARVVSPETAQSKIHIYGLGATARSNDPILNNTFSFAYDPKLSDWSGYRYLELWIKVNGSYEVEVQLYDVFYNWSLWKVDVEERVWNLVAIRLDKPDVYGGLDRSRIGTVVFSIRGPSDRLVEVEVGGMFLDPGYETKIVREPEPLEIFMQKPQFIIYELPDGFRNPRIYTVDRTIPLNSTKKLFDKFLSEKFDPRTSVFIEGERLNVSHVEISYSERSPLQYRVTVYNPTEPFLLVLNERFDPGWSLYIGEPGLLDVLTGREGVNVRHLRVNGFFNGWYVKPPKGVTFLLLIILYKPQVLLDILKNLSLGFAVAGLTIGFLRRLVETESTIDASVG